MSESTQVWAVCPPYCNGGKNADEGKLIQISHISYEMIEETINK